ncbi:MAG: ion transporter [Lachnospiraceae bacterium]|nr:ion transporter [Lachnospiraceae bacterium]
MAEIIHSRKRRIFDIIQIGNKTDLISTAFDYFLVIMIVLNITVLFLQTFDQMAPYEYVLDVVESFTVAVFIVEYALRIWTSQFLFPGRSFIYSATHFIVSFDGIVDLLTILPFFFLSGFVVFRMLRVVRIFRLFRINSTYDSFNVIKAVLYDKRNQLMSSIFIILILMLSASLFMYSAEHDAQPDIFKNAFSGIWWSVSTLLTVGYGDIYPVTPIGKFLAILIAFLGVGAVAIPTGIISAGFVEQYTRLAQADGAFDLTMGIQAVVIDIDSAWLGKTVEEVETNYQTTILLIRQRSKRFVPQKEYRIQLGDAVAIL